MRNFEMLAKEVDGIVYSDRSKCPNGDCPSVLKRSDGSMIVIGRAMTNGEISELEQSGLVKVHDGELAIFVQAELLRVGSKSL